LRPGDGQIGAGCSFEFRQALEHLGHGVRVPDHGGQLPEQHLPLGLERGDTSQRLRLRFVGFDERRSVQHHEKCE
jgi:hypothetical protein